MGAFYQRTHMKPCPSILIHIHTQKIHTLEEAQRAGMQKQFYGNDLSVISHVPVLFYIKTVVITFHPYIIMFGNTLQVHLTTLRGVTTNSIGSTHQSVHSVSSVLKSALLLLIES